jgi:phosphatidylglycerophosphate synthase
MLERGATLRVFERRVTLQWARDPLVGVAAQVGLLAALARTVGLGDAGWLVGIASAFVLGGALARSLERDGAARLGPADWVTLTRASLAVGVAALVARSFESTTSLATLLALASVALALDFVDGRVARYTNTASPLGAWLDGEVDAFLILALSAYAARSAGVWVLAIGLARYAFLAAGVPFAWMRATLPRRDWRKVVAAAQGSTLVLAAADVVPLATMRALLAVALALLAESFGRDVWWLRRHRCAVRDRKRSGAAPAALTLLAAVVVWAALVTPTKPWLLTPASFVRLPLEGIVVVILAVVLPPRARRFLPWAVGPALGLLILLKILDIGFFIAFDRPFNPVDDWTFLSFGVETTRITFGRTTSYLTVAAAVLIVVLALALPTLAVLRLTRVAAGHRRQSLRAGAGLTGVWFVCWAIGGLGSHTGIASASGAALAIDEVHAVQADLRDHARFDAALRTDRFRNTPGSRLLTGLRGKDVLLVFLESYGKLAVEGSPFSPDVDSILGAGTKQLAAAGFSARSGWLTSSTFGGGSWWAHATLQSGTWINTQGRYDELVKSDRLTLASAFARAGWTTVAEDPSNNRNWPEGRSFYRYDQIYDRRNLGYRGPTFGFSSMPDEYTLLAFQRLVLGKAHTRPVFAEIDTTSSHTPWTRIPPLIPWSRVGDGSVFERLPIDRSGLTDTRQGYSTSIEYALRTLFSFIQHYGNDNTVLVVLGDHQPSRVAVEQQPGHDVPISIIARDPSVLDRVADWGWVEGMQPTDDAPVWRMDAFRNRFLSAFGS